VSAPGTGDLEPAVAAHYDVLDPYYRRIWGEHVHHGLWRTGAQTPATAARALAIEVADRAEVRRGDRVVDVGCGYGATARLLAAERGATVTGLTLSAAQVAAAPPAAGVELLVRSWLANRLPDGGFDAAIAIESLSHMADRGRAFAELGRVVRPGGRVVVVDWLAADRVRPAQRRLLLDPIRDESRLPRLSTVPAYAAELEAAGFALTATADLSGRVWRTWVVVARRLAALLARDGAARRELLGAANPERAFALSILRIPVAYRTGALRLVLVAGRRR
jgi:tocopherol O-methyltransferase